MQNPIIGTWEEFIKDIKIVSRTRTAYSELQSDLLTDLLSEILCKDLFAQYIYLSYRTFVAIRKWGRDIYVSETLQEKLDQGYLGNFRGATFAVTNTIPEKIVLVVSSSTPLNGTLGALLVMDEDIPGAKELIKAHDTLKSALYLTKGVIDSIAIKTERTN